MSGKYTLGSYYRPSVLDYNRAYKTLAIKHVEYFEREIDYLKDFKPATYEGLLTKYRAMNEAYFYKRYYKSVYNYYDKLC